MPNKRETNVNAPHQHLLPLIGKLHHEIKQAVETLPEACMHMGKVRALHSAANSAEYKAFCRICTACKWCYYLARELRQTFIVIWNTMLRSFLRRQLQGCLTVKLWNRMKLLRKLLNLKRKPHEKIGSQKAKSKDSR